jgi:uncharacterized protein (DUF427 family)
MSLTVGTGPFGHAPTGRFDFDPPGRITFIELHPRRVRAMKEGAVVVDSDRVRLVYRTGSLPVFAFPAEDVSVPSEPEPAVDGYVTVPWDAVDRWLEEEDEIVVHPRDPYHRIDVCNSARHVRIRVNDVLVAETTSSRILFETALPPRYYIVREDVRLDLLEGLELTTGCAYKGFARYFSAAGADAVAWCYPEPRRDGELVQNRICFFQERPEVALEIDGVAQSRPQTVWSNRDWISRYRSAA